jgi:hypothetical protein
MWELLWLIALVFSIVAWPTWMIRRMKRIQRQLVDHDAHEDSAPHYHERSEEIVRSDKGFVYAKSHEANPDLIAADKKAAEMPDIVKTLEGRR